jgi:ABC-type bacteriocin/lantibiotic exporter with double-glycine peptidase domain
MCIAFNLLTKQISFSEVALFKNSMTTVSNYLSTNLNFNINSSSVIVAKEKIDGFFEIINAQEPKQALKREEKGNKIVFKNYVLSLENSTLLKLDGIAFEIGKRYALTGKSGCGKSSSLIDLKQGVCGALKSSGEIIFPKGEENSKPKVMFLDQELYLPKDSTLLEAIYFPKIFDHLSSEKQDQLKEQILSFFKELEIDNFIEVSDEKAEGLASKLDLIQYKLSGGQRKKIGIIQAILSQPEILIMDEIFTGLDPNSLIKCQSFIKKYLPQALILSVDHHAADNNFNGFYDSEMHYFEGGVTERKIEQKII